MRTGAGSLGKNLAVAQLFQNRFLCCRQYDGRWLLSDDRA
jgi:hypothetical protein